MRKLYGRGVCWAIVTTVVAVAALGTWGAEAQTRQLQVAPQRSTTPQRATDEVRRAESIPVVRQLPEAKSAATSAARAKPAAPLSTAAKLQALTPSQPPTAGTSVQGKEPPKISTLRLTVQSPYAYNRGYLVLNDVHRLDAENNFASWENSKSATGDVQVHVNLEKGKRYLADMIVYCDGPRNFLYGFEAVSVQEGNHHLLMLLEPDTSGWKSLILHNGTGYTFYAFEISVQE